MSITPHLRRIGGIVACGVVIAGVSVIAQVSISLKPGPWTMLEGGVGDARPEIGPIVHVPFDDIQRGYHRIEPGQLDLRMEVDAD